MIRKLRAIALQARKRMGCFTWTVMTTKEVEAEGNVDPPCALLKGTMGSQPLITVTMDVDGEVLLQAGASVFDYLPTIDLSQRPDQVAAQLCLEIMEFSKP